MAENRIAEIVNILADMLLDRGVDELELCEALDMDSYEAAFMGLSWLHRQCGYREDDDE